MRDILRLPAVRVSFAVLALTVLLDAICAARMPFQVKAGPLWDTASVCLGLMVLAVVMSVLRSRVEGDTAWQARAIGTVCERIAHACLIMIVFVGFGMPAVLLSAFAAAAGASMQDAAFSAIDRALGFDWEAFVAALNAHPAVVTVLIAAYNCVPITFAGLTVFFFGSGRLRAMWDMMALLVLGAFATVAVSAFVPALGGYTYYGPDPRSTSEFIRQWPEAGTYYVEGLLTLNSGLTHTIDLDQVKGLVQFPSLHGILALVLIVTAWPYRMLRLPYLAINAVMIVSTVPVGGHHAADLLGSIGVVIASMALMDALEGRRSLWQRLNGALRGPAEPAEAAAAIAGAGS